MQSNHMDGVKAFLFMFFAAVVLIVPMTLGGVAFLLSLIGVDIDQISNTFVIFIWLAASFVFALWGVHDMDKKKNRT